MFSNGAYVKIWDINKGNGNYYVANMSTSRKLDSGEYERDWSDGRVMLVGTAAKQAENIKKGDSLQIDNCGVTNQYDKDKKVMYTNYKIFSFAESDGGGKKKSSSKSSGKVKKDFINVPEDAGDDDELPFN